MVGEIDILKVEGERRLTRICRKDGSIAGLEIKGSRAGGSDEDCCTCVAFDEI